MRNHNIVLFFSFNQKVDGSVIKMGKHLYEVKGSTQGQGISKAEVQAAADAILQPLMDLLDGNNKRIIFLLKNSICHYYIILICILKGSLSEFAQICDKSVLKRLLKELWKLVIHSLEKNIVLPSVTDYSVRSYS